jgi:hypothetical protein
MIRYRALLIAAGYPDSNDCDALKPDPAFKMAVGRLPESGADLCCSTDHQPAGKPAQCDRAQTHDGGNGRVVLRQLRSGSPTHPARHRRH